jgi:peroxiredoxin
MAVAKGRNSVARATKTLKVGDKAPDFTLARHNGDEVWRLSDQLGKKNVLISFYPFAFSPTCSVQIPTYEEHLSRFEDLGTDVVGISIDSRYANAAWAERLGGITFPLLSDFYPHGAVAEAYGVMRPQGMAERALFIIDREGVIRYIDVHELREAPDEAVLFEELAKLG